MADDAFKLPQSSYETVCKILMAYAQIGEKTDLTTVAGLLGTDNGTVSRNVGFLMSLGLLEGGRDKGATAEGARLGRALQFREQDDITRIWREVLAPHPLVQRILMAIRVRGGMDANTLQTQIVYTAGANKTSGNITGGAALVEMLRVAQLVVERDGKLIAGSPSDAPVADEPEEPETVSQPTSSSPAPVPVLQRVVEVPAAGGISVQIELNISVVAEPADLPELGARIRGMLENIRPTEDSVEPDQS